ncbi:MAG TPA: phosphotransferase [Thiobacillaceae bacterium]|nr:phosphotransferase [Thiobacillaceae bacterium]
MERLESLRRWVTACLGSQEFDLAPASSDASFRRYFRATFDGGNYIVMDAPPSHEDCRPFIKVARLFADAGAHVPRVLAEDLTQGFLLLSDLGPVTYLSMLRESSARELYLAANAALVKIQLASRPGELPAYDRELLLRELSLFPDWYIAMHLGQTLTDGQARLMNQAFERILANNLAQPRVYVHRDYHSRNLMVSEPNPGILDFQDAVYGPITYDLASLYKDAYIRWEEEQVLDWVIRYWEAARKARLPVTADFYEFYRDFEWMGAQRHIKILGIFARLCYRDGKDAYLKDMPLVMDYLRKACERYGDLYPMLRLLDQLENRSAQMGYTF